MSGEPLGEIEQTAGASFVAPSWRSAAVVVVVSGVLLCVSIAGGAAAIGAFWGAFEGTWPTLSGTVSTCGYAPVDSVCQSSLRATVSAWSLLRLPVESLVHSAEATGAPVSGHRARVSIPPGVGSPLDDSVVFGSSVERARADDVALFGEDAISVRAATSPDGLVHVAEATLPDGTRILIVTSRG